MNFFLRSDPESKREVAFAISGDYLLLATREDLMAGALQLMAGQPDRNVESEQWWAQSTTAAGQPGDLRMVLDLAKLVPNGYFRTYWVQQNITDLSQYSAAVSDLFRSPHQYREERILIRKKELEKATSADGLAAAAELQRLVPDDAGVYVAAANPTADSCFALLETKLLAPHLGPAPLRKSRHKCSSPQGSKAEPPTWRRASIGSKLSALRSNRNRRCRNCSRRLSFSLLSSCNRPSATRRVFSYELIRQ